MGIFSRYFLYLLDCAVMLAIVGVQVYLFRGEDPMVYYPGEWFALLLEDYAAIGLWTVVFTSVYWTIVDYHSALIRIRGRVLNQATGQLPTYDVRVLRSVVKAVTLFVLPWLLLYALFSDGHRLLHDRIAGTERLEAQQTRG
ncbi:hypothetical protein [Neolewinella sp.]|uniref:hypothetical protein n=1 Tax=Neolewinella sp. TaxID=2993543 RepID=UPI003B521D63